MERHAQHSNSPADRAKTAWLPRNNRTRIGNGSILPAGVDGRSSTARRWKEIYADAVRQTGGRNAVLCRSFASLVVQREQVDAAIARGEPSDTALLIKLSGEIRRLMTKLGLVDEEPEPPAAAAPLPADAPAWLLGKRESAAVEPAE